MSLGVELEGGINEGGLEKVRNYVDNKKWNKFFSISGDGSVWVDGFDRSNAEIRF